MSLSPNNGSLGRMRSHSADFQTNPICQLAADGNLKQLQKLYSAPSPTSRDPLLDITDSHGMTPLHCAALEGQVQVVEFLIKLEADLFTLDKNKWMPIHCSAAGSAIGERTPDHLSCCELLLRAGSDPNAVTETGTSVMHYLVRYPYSEKLVDVLRLLRDYGADVDVVDDLGDAPLHQAAFRGCKETCSFLIASGAAVTAVNQQNETPLHIAVRHTPKDERKEIVQLLLDNGADPFIVGNNGTARDIALTSDNQEVIDILDAAEMERNELESISLTNSQEALSAVTHSTSTPNHSRQEQTDRRKMLSRQYSSILGRRDAFLTFGIDQAGLSSSPSPVSSSTSSFPSSPTLSSGRLLRTLSDKKRNPPPKPPKPVLSTSPPVISPSSSPLPSLSSCCTPSFPTSSSSPIPSRLSERIVFSSSGRLRTLQKSFLVSSHPDFNLERGTKSREAKAKSFCLQYEAEHDDFFFLFNFVKDPEGYLRHLQLQEHSSSSSTATSSTTITTSSSPSFSSSSHSPSSSSPSTTSSSSSSSHSISSLGSGISLLSSGSGSFSSSDPFYPHVHVIASQGGRQVVVSMRKVPDSRHFYSGIVRSHTHDSQFLWSASDLEVKEGKTVSTKQLLRTLHHKYPTLGRLQVVKDNTFSKALLQLELKLKIQSHKFGVVFCRDTPTNETVFQENETTPEFLRFLQFLGNRVELKGYQGYKGDLDVKNSAEGQHSYATEWQHLEFMFQISPLLSVDRRGPMIRNTLTTIIYLENGTIDLSVITSQLLHVIIVVQPLKSQVGPRGTPLYKVIVAAKKGVPRFTPVLPWPGVFELDGNFREWLFYKMVNGERAAYHCTSKSQVHRQLRSMSEITQGAREGHLNLCVEQLQKRKKTAKK